MSRQFSILTVLRMAPNRMLLELFQTLGYPDVDRDWQGLKEREIEPIQKAISHRTVDEQSLIERELRGIFELACPPGIDSILEAARLHTLSEFATTLPTDVGVYHKSIWTRINYPAVFETALRIHNFENFSWWRKRNDLPSVAIVMDDPLKDKLEHALSDLFNRAQGRGSPCTVEHFRREDGTEYFYAHPDDFAQEASAHDGDRKLTVITVRTTFSVVFAYNASEGSLDLHAKVTAKLKSELESLFCLTVLDFNPGPWEPGAAYELNRLKDRTLVLATDAADCVRVQVRKLRLSGKNTGRRATVEISDDDDDIHDAIDEWINQARVPLDAVNVTQATFRFEFRDLDQRKPGFETFDVTWPSSCNLRGRPPERVAIIEKYLKRWKISVGKRRPIDPSSIESRPTDPVGLRVEAAP